MAKNASAPATRDSGGDDAWLTTGVAAAIYFLLALIYFLPAFAPGRQIFGTDYLAGGYMFYDFVGERLGSGALPKWVPYVYGGLPLAANPGSAYHPVHFLSDLLLPTSKVLAAVFTIHFWIAGLGMLLLARELGCRRWIAFVAGLAFQFTGITMSWVYAGHDGRIMVATVAPLFFYCLHRGIRTGRAAPFAGASLTLGLALLSFQIQNSYYLLVAAAIWSLFAIIHLGIGADRARLARTVGLGLASVALGFLLAAVNFLPFLDYIPESPRGTEGRGYEFSTSYSMPPGEIVSLAVPEHFGVSVYDPEADKALFPAYQGQNGFKLHTEYVGAFVLLLLAAGAFYSRRNAYWWFFLGLSLFGLTVAFGGHTPIYRLYYELLPGTKQFRAPSLIFFVISLSLVTMAALTLERLAAMRDEAASRTGEDDGLRLFPWIALGVVALAFVGAAAAPPGQPGAPSAAQGWARFGLFCAMVGGVLWLWLAGRMARGIMMVLLAAITLLDLWAIDRKFFHTVGGPDEVFAGDDVTAFLTSQPAPNRVWAFPYPQAWGRGGGNGGNYPMLFDIAQAGGEHPNPLQRWIEFIGAGEQTFTDWHNFAADPVVVNTPEGQAIGFRSTPGFLEAANIRYIVSLAPLAYEGLREVYRGSALVYENTGALPRAYLVPMVQEVADSLTLAALLRPGWDPRQVAVVPVTAGVELPTGPMRGDAAVSEYSPDRVVVRSTADRAAMLVLADNFYRGWHATVAGRDAPVVRVNHTLRGVVVPAGTSEVVFTYRPGDLIAGLVVSVVTLITLLAILGLHFARRRRLAEVTT